MDRQEFFDILILFLIFSLPITIFAWIIGLLPLAVTFWLAVLLLGSAFIAASQPRK
jgi:hypothetical protein